MLNMNDKLRILKKFSNLLFLPIHEYGSSSSDTLNLGGYKLYLLLENNILMSLQYLYIDTVYLEES